MTTSLAEFMKKDHDRLDDLFKRFQAMKRQNAQRARSLFHEFMTGLLRHIVWEEDILFPLFSAKADIDDDQGPTAVMREEHRQIKTFLDRIQTKIASGDPATEEAEHSLLKVLTAHNVKEEQILYPWMDKCVSQEERPALFAQMENLPTDRYTRL
jgi:regulator of cell morphogenesis and NO signaling